MLEVTLASMTCTDRYSSILVPIYKDSTTLPPYVVFDIAIEGQQHRKYMTDLMVIKVTRTQAICVNT